MTRSYALRYLAALALCALAGLALLRWGTSLYGVGGASVATPLLPASPAPAAYNPLTTLLIQVCVILAAARLCAFLIRRVGQPAVVGEILAGILLGPSLLGAISPGALDALFPPASLPALSLFGQIGVLLFMFVVGLEVDLKRQAQHARAAIAVSHAGMILPFLLGIAFTLAAYRELAPAGVPFATLALVVGIARSVTAFPVLARILKERKLTDTELGQRAIGCAAIGDVLAWSVLALVVAITRAHGLAQGAGTIVLALAFAALMIGLARRPLARVVEAYYIPGGREGWPLIAGMLIFAFTSAVITELIGIHALFGAFLAGTLVSGNREFRTYLHDRVLPLSSLIMLPLFFALVGLRTKLGLLDSASDWLMCAAIVAIATAGKLGGAMLASRFTGASWRESFALGVLLNTRGLMELIVLNIGYELGILSPRVFTMFVIMALLTTLLTGPLVQRALSKSWSVPD
jgi:Kef-type K+ transport system membrane component KefB